MPKIDTAKLHVLPGRATPLGPEVYESGVRFAIVSRHATRVWLALFENVDDARPAVELEFEPHRHRIGDVWSIFVRGLPHDALYMYRMDGPFAAAEGHRYDPAAYLLDPYARMIVGDVQARRAKCRVFDDDPDWRHDVRPHISWGDLIIYETHVRGFTVHESSDVAPAGTYAGLVEKIPHLQDLGVTAVELLPVQEFGETRMGRCSLATRKELRNYWGYNSIGFFAPSGAFATHGGNGEQVDEFRRMVAALHKAGIEIILDVVFNHTAEGGELGPTLCFRGIDNAIYYMLDEAGGYRNFSGCGNTVNCNHPIVREFIEDCLRYWVTVMHVDGFRFDLASILGRDTKGLLVQAPALIERIEEDPVLRDTKLIAEAWDAGGAYQVGSFGDVRWAEWNGKYRDDVRRYWRGDKDVKGLFATRLAGSADLYQGAGRTPQHSINFVTAHDGFTLRDLVSYNEKHNLANGHNNLDGTDVNFSWNCGVEGETADPGVNALRTRMQKDFLATLFLSLGVPMMLGGDEFGRTQKGNNNAYCQDNETSWYDWTLLAKNEDLFRFCKEVIRFRKSNPALTRMAYFNGRPAAPGGPPDVAWFDEKGKPMVWEAPQPFLACRVDGSQNGSVALYVMFNPTLRPVAFAIPEGAWAVRIDTAKRAPDDIREADGAPLLTGPSELVLEPKTLAVLSERVDP